LKKYFSIDESLKFLNKNIEEVEQLNIRDLFLLSVQEKIKPCFYYDDYCLWQESRNTSYYYEKIYPSPIKGYFSTLYLGDILLRCLDYNTDSFEIKWCKEVEALSTTAPHEVENICLISYSDFKSDTLRKSFLLSSSPKRDCHHEIMNGIGDGKFIEWVYYEHSGIEIKLNDIYYPKEDLTALLNTSTSNNLFDENLQLKLQLTQVHERIKQLEAENHDQLSPEQDVPNSTERNGVSKLILVLAEMAKIDISKPHAQHESLKAQAELLGIDRFPNDDTVAKWFKKARGFKNN